MTVRKFITISFLQWVVLFPLKIFYFKGSFGEGIVAQVWYLAITAFIVLVLVRRIGVITYLEAIFLAIFWFLADLFLELLITASISGVGMFKSLALWLGYLVLMLTVFLFHKKRHIQVRKEQHAHHH